MKTIYAMFANTMGDSVIECRLCPQHCRLEPGRTGICRSRKNVDGKLIVLNYGRVCSIHIDPIEKKPLYHFLPGSDILSLGNNGCNLHCRFCQNWEISQREIPTRFIDPSDLVALVEQRKVPSVAFTYAEPIIWFEYLLDACKILKNNNIKTVLVTNGMIDPKPLSVLLPYVDAMNIDIKSMSDDFYGRLCGGSLKPVLKTAETAAKVCHVEITNLVITGENDSSEAFHQLGRFIRDHLGRRTVLHLSRYHPAYRMSNPATPLATLVRAREITRTYLDFVYLGNIWGNEYNSTICPSCGRMLIRRDGFRVDEIDIYPDGTCPECGYQTAIHLS